MERILITGAGGYIGSNAVEYFIRKGYAVTGMVHKNVCDRFSKSGAEAINADLGIPASLDALFTLRDYDYVLHIAAFASDVGSENVFRIANYEAVRQLASLSMRHGVKRFVYLSTADVYGLHNFNGESEDSLRFDLNATNPYPKYKIKSELWLAENIPEESFSCVRPCVVFGNGDTTITPRTLNYIKNSPFVLHFGKWKGRNRWPLAHVENVCRTLHAAMLLPEAAGKGVTVLDSKRTTISEYYHELAKEFLPGKRLRELTLPRGVILPIAWLSTTLSSHLPIFDFTSCATALTSWAAAAPKSCAAAFSPSAPKSCAAAFSPPKEILPAFSRHHPLFDPTLYALDTISHNLDFSNERMLNWLKSAKLEEFIHDSYR